MLRRGRCELGGSSITPRAKKGLRWARNRAGWFLDADDYRFKSESEGGPVVSRCQVEVRSIEIYAEQRRVGLLRLEAEVS